MHDRGAAYYRLALILGSLTAMGPLAIDTYLPALPTITGEFHTTAAAVQLSLSAYFIGIALGQAFYGPFSDRHGRRPPLFAGLGLFVIGSLGCALAPGIRTLVTFRFIQALGGCAPLVVPRAVVRDLFDERDSIRMLSVLILVMGVAPILAPLGGGQLLVHLGWRSIFWFYVAYGTILLTIVAVGLRESLPDDRRSHQPIGVVNAVARAPACGSEIRCLSRRHPRSALARPFFIGSSWTSESRGARRGCAFRNVLCKSHHARSPLSLRAGRNALD